MNKLSLATFTNLGYRWHSRHFEPIETDLRGRTVVITGGSGGLGLAAAAELGRLGARVALVARSPDKLAEAAGQVEGAVTYQADLSLFADIRRLAARLLEAEDRVDVLVNNVGVLLPEREETEEGVEKTLATDLAGHFLLTNLLMPRLLASTPARIINVTSGGMYAEKIRPHDLQYEQGEYRGTTAYARAKRGQVILTEMWADRLRPHGVTVHAMHPGWARTEGVAYSLPTFNRLMGPFLRSPEQGADTIVWLAAADEPADQSGKLWFDRQTVATHLLDSTRETPAERAALWENLVELTGSDLEVER